MCQRCHRRDDTQQGSPGLFTVGNKLDPGCVPAFLPQLSQIEEQLIARAHVHIQMRTVHGVQHKYSGHVVTFLQNTLRLYDELPRLPSDIDSVISQPANANNVLALRR